MQIEKARADLFVYLPDGSFTYQYEEIELACWTRLRRRMRECTQVQTEELELGMGITHPTGKFQNVRFDLKVRTPYPKGEREAAFDEVEAWINKKLETMIDDTNQAFGLGPTGFSEAAPNG
jgi:hypothetical protein